MKLGKIVSSLMSRTVGRVKAARYGKVDLGIVKVALMVAALDGEVTEEEYKALDALVKKCRGYTKKAADKAMSEAMRSAGFLLLFGRRASDREFVKAFVAEARTALPNGFEDLSVEEVRRAIVMWIAMGMSDGDYSAREKKCIEAIRKAFAEHKALRQQEAIDLGAQMAGVSLAVPPDFITSAEELVAQYGDEAGAAKALENLIAADGDR